ncbi:RHS repeat protein [Thalassomonas viridans]|uniref:RHS repeat protein n=1 Tax=Thalassomonas viridans TaxID=137584 RepID=A0AAE9YZ68_9GAMM|nr:RHS repeat protein [Thalassomonas viridans]WDE03685.1 RHS repeat protein [Thalassomonas viridans]
MDSKKIRLGVLCLATFSALCSFAPFPAKATDEDPYASEIYAADNHKIDPETASGQLQAVDANFAGDQVNTYDGSVSFRQTDLSLPGNSGLPVEITRIKNGFTSQYYDTFTEFHDWELAIPEIKGRYTKGINRFSPNYPFPEKACSDTLDAFKDNIARPFIGFTLSINGGHKLLYQLDHQQSAIDYPAGTKYITEDHWVVKCITTDDGEEGFQATSPQGVIYTFALYKKEFNRTIRFPVTKVEDRFGNWVKYQYNPDDGSRQARLMSIAANDNRRIDLTWQEVTNHLIKWPHKGYRITQVKANTGEIWRYDYKVWPISIHPDEPRNLYALNKATRPDGSAWNYGLQIMHVANLASRTSGNTNIYNVSSPDGAQAEFYFLPKVLDQGYLVDSEGLNYADTINYRTDRFAVLQVMQSITEVLTKKSVKAGKWAAREYWTYEFTQGQLNKSAGFNDQGKTMRIDITDASPVRELTVTNPDQSITRYRYNQAFGKEEGQLDEVTLFATANELDNNSPLKQEVYRWDYNLIPGAPCYYINCKPGASDQSPGSRKMPEHHYRKQLVEKTIVQDGVTYVTKLHAFDDYGFPTLTSQTNQTQGKARWVKQENYHDSHNWLLGLPARQWLSATNGQWTEVSATSYHSPTSAYKSLPYQESRFGVLQKSMMRYSGEGNLLETRYNALNQRQLLDNYHRGIPQKERVTNRYNAALFDEITRQVDDRGAILYEVNELGQKTEYSYDVLKRVTKIKYPGSGRLDTNIAYDTGGSLSFGSDFTKTVTEGNREVVEHYDGMKRLMGREQKDLSQPDKTKSYVNYGYNIFGQQTFQSQANNRSKGIETYYDALQRKTKILDNVTGNSTRFEYLTGNKTAVTDAKNHRTVTSYLAYGEPGQEQPLLIAAPENVNTSFSYNIFGGVTGITQGGITRTQVYDDQQRLCKRFDPESNWTYFDYDVLGKVLWQAKGISSVTSGCDRHLVADKDKIKNSYDFKGELKAIDYPGATPDKTFTLDPLGNMLTVESGATRWTYTYNPLNELSKEVLTVDGKSFTSLRTYTALGHLKTLTYPSGKTIDFSPNALGQPGKVGQHISNIEYFDNGQLEGFAYANGATYSAKQNDSQLHSEDLLKVNIISMASLQYGYDDNNNLSGISDEIQPQHSVTMGYDGLNRLTRADGSWGSGLVYYDQLGNITAKHMGGQQLDYLYDANNRLTSVTKNNNAFYTFSYDVRGNVTSNGVKDFSFNDANQLTSAEGFVINADSAAIFTNFAGDFAYDGHDRRVKKTHQGKTSYFFYSQDGSLLFQQKANGRTVDYVHLQGRLVAEVEM